MQRNCLAINHIKTILLPKEVAYINFQNFQRLIKSSIEIYSDFECILIPSTDINIKYHVVCSYNYILVCADERFSKPYMLLKNF